AGNGRVNQRGPARKSDASRTRIGFEELAVRQAGESHDFVHEKLSGTSLMPGRAARSFSTVPAPAPGRRRACSPGRRPDPSRKRRPTATILANRKLRGGETRQRNSPPTVSRTEPR